MAHETTENTRLDHQQRLDGERTAAERNRLGQFATPAPLAAEIAIAALSAHGDQAVRFLEPSVGSGSFFSALKRAQHPAGIARAVGFEVDPRFADAARGLWAESGLRVELADFTRVAPPEHQLEKATLVMANPPYVRHHHLDTSHKVELQRKAEAALGRPVSGLTGLYVYFVICAHEWMAPGAVAAWLVPTEWMDVNYGAALKHYLCHKVELLRVHRFAAEDVQFSDALVSSSVVIFRRATPDASTRCSFTVGDLSNPARANLVEVSEIDGARKWSRFFRGHAVARSEPAAVTLGDLLHVRRGIATGGNDFFIRARSEFRKLGIPDRFLRPILPSSRYLESSEIGRAADGYPDLAEPLALLDCELSEGEVRANWASLWGYLESVSGQQARTGYLTSGRRPWYSQERRPVAPIIATYMGRGRSGAKPFRFFWNRSDATATNVYLLLIPKPALASAISRTPQVAGDIVRFLADTDAAELLGHGRVYGGGLHKLEPNELGRLDATLLATRLGIPADRKGERQMSRLGMRDVQVGAVSESRLRRCPSA